MATGGAVTEDGLEFWLNKCTNVLSHSEDWEAIVGFCDRINKDPEGPQTALKLLVHKIQSPQEKESLLALITLEACAKNCGRRFQQEVGKFRFLNEIIKVISPKFLGNMTTQRVKDRCIELLYNWSEVLEYEPKIKEAYQMLRRQGIVKKDPVTHDQSLEPGPLLPQPLPPPPPPRASIFDNDEKSKLLSRLLRSKNPDDLIAANRLIKNMVKQDAERTEKLTQRTQQLDVTYNNVKLLTDMLRNYQPDTTTESDKEIMKELYDNLEKQRPKLFRLASETDESDESGITDILKANDEVIRVMALYEDTVHRPDVDSLLVEHRNDASHEPSASLAASGEAPPSYTTTLLDDQLLKLGLDDGPSGMVTNGVLHVSQNNDLTDLLSHSATATNAPTMSALDALLQSSHRPLSNATLMTDQLRSSSNVPGAFQSPGVASVGPPSAGIQLTSVQPLFAAQTATVNSSLLQTTATPLQPTPAFSPADDDKSDFIFAGAADSSGAENSVSGGLSSLDALGQSALEQSRSGSASTTQWITRHQQISQSKIPMNQMTKPAASTADNAPSSLARNDASSDEIQPLNDVFVTLESIQPGDHAAITAYDKNGVKILFHIGKDRPRPDVVVIAVSVMSVSTSAISAFTFQAAVPKVMKVKLQPASAADLPAHNPILPPAAITQVMLIAHRPQDKILLKFKISYSLKDAVTTDVGEVQFPYGI